MTHILELPDALGQIDNLPPAHWVVCEEWGSPVVWAPLCHDGEDY